MVWYGMWQCTNDQAGCLGGDSFCFVALAEPHRDDGLGAGLGGMARLATVEAS